MNNDTKISLMAGAVEELYYLVDNKIIELQNELLEVEELEEILTEIREYRRIRNRLFNYL